MNKKQYTDIIDIFIILASVVLAIITLLSPFIAIAYYSSCQEAKIFNELNQTEYTCQDFFWAKDQINTQVQTIRLEK